MAVVKHPQHRVKYKWGRLIRVLNMVFVLLPFWARRETGDRSGQGCDRVQLLRFGLRKTGGAC